MLCLGYRPFLLKTQAPASPGVGGSSGLASTAAWPRERLMLARFCTASVISVSGSGATPQAIAVVSTTSEGMARK